MPSKGPHISIASEHLLSRVLNLSTADTEGWPEDVRELALLLAEELFLLRYNPFIDPGLVYISVKTRLRENLPSLSQEYATTLEGGVQQFWKEYKEDQAFKEQLMRRLRKILPEEAIATRPNMLVE